MKLNIDHYKESEFNRITDIEKEIIDLFFKNDEINDLESLLHAKSDYEHVKAISDSRKNIIGFYPIEKEKTVLEIGANFGEITAELCSKAKKVVSIESKLEKAESIAKRHKEIENLEVYAGELKDINLNEKFDYIVLIGKLDNENDLDSVMEELKRYLKDDGKILLTINNHFTNKFLAKINNAGDDNNIESLKDSNCVEIDLLQRKLQDNQFMTKVYYPIPDYVFTNAIYSDEFLPNEEHISSRYWEMFDAKLKNINYLEKEKIKEIVKKDPNLIKIFANSYLIVAQKDIKDIDVKAVTYGMYRKKEYRIKTLIKENEVIKVANHEDGLKHIYNIKENIELLNAVGIKTLDRFENDSIISKFVKDELTVDKIVINLLKCGKKEEAFEKINQFKTELLDKFEKVDFTEENVFTKFNIECNAEEIRKLTYVKKGLFDLIFQNCFVINDEFYVYDQEWLEENVPVEFILYRAIKNLPEINDYVDINEVYKKFNIAEHVDVLEKLDRKILKDLYNDFLWEVYVRAYTTVENEKEINKNKDKALSELKKIVFDKEVHIQNLENEIISCNYRIQNYENQLSIITYSLSWRITKPLRYISWMLNPKTNAKFIDRILQPGSNIRAKYDARKAKKILKAKEARYRKATDEAGVEYWKQIEERERAKKEKDAARESSSKFSDYEMWMKYNTPSEEELEKQRKYKFKTRPKISIVIPLYNTPEDLFRELLFNMHRQTYSNWELCLADGSNEKLEYIENMCKDPRIHYKFLGENKGISGNSNEGLKMVTGDYVALLDHDDLLSQDALFEIVKVINEKPEVRFIYTDEDKMTTIDIPRFDPHFKPDFAPDTLRCQNYICHFSVFKKEVMDKLEGFRDEYNGAQDMDIILRMSEIVKPEEIYHIPKILYHWRMSTTSTAGDPETKLYAYEAGKKAVQHHIDRLGLSGVVERNKDIYGIYEAQYEIKGDPLVNILIPNKNNVQKLKECIDSIISKTNYKNYEIDIIDDNSEDEEILQYYNQLKENNKVKLIKYDQTNSSFAKLINFGAKNTTGEYLVQWNVNNQIIEEKWLDILLGYAQMPSIGAVYGKVFDKYNNILQSMITFGGSKGKLYLNKGQSKDVYGYFAKENQIQNSSCTGKNMVICKKSIFEEVGGLNEEIPGLEEVDFGLSLRKLNLLNVFVPNAQIYSEDFEEEILEDTISKVKTTWNEFYLKGDEYYNKNLSLETNNFEIRTEKIL